MKLLGYIIFKEMFLYKICQEYNFSEKSESVKENMRQRKRLLAVLLVFAMILSMCSSMGTIVAKAAEGGVTFVSRTDFLNKLEKMNAEFTGFDMNGNTTIKSITFEYTAPSDTYTISDVNFAESESDVIHGAYKESEDGSGYDAMSVS